MRKQVAELKTREMQHQKTERALRDRLFFFQRLIDTIPTPIFFKDVHGYYRGCNRAFEEYTGFRRERLIGKFADDFPSPGISPQFRHRDELLLYRPGVQGYEVTIQHTDGSFRNILFRKATLTDEGGDPAGLIGIMFDLTERKRAEEALMAALAGEENERAGTESIIAAIGEAVTIQDRGRGICGSRCGNRSRQCPGYCAKDQECGRVPLF
ncbi:MAG: PAS domain S-box protein [Alphaproteobacteria bacterium]|uniref:PAS domain S-box protein n=1 Tax=Candidatus Nitrobium versatile TaxID=2884831 RepID=A0A953J9I1_9BACT|nr:PAS domain S-box protein [Candidatus Nitrobium versatile]